MYYGAVWSRRAVLTWNDLKHTVLLHVGGKVPSPHVLLHYANVGQLLTERGKNRPRVRKFVLSGAVDGAGTGRFFKAMHKRAE